MNKRFEEIYSNNEWGHGSGEGSLPEHNEGYVKFLQSFISNNEIKTVVEMGCGDWQFSKIIDWGIATYRGFDVVQNVVDRNHREFSRPGVEFKLYSGQADELPVADLLIVKDVLQHLSNARIQAVIPAFGRFRKVLVTNCVNPRGHTVHHDIEDGDFRYLDLRLTPFNVKATEVYSYTHRTNPLQRFLSRRRWFKRVLLIDPSRAST